MRSRVGCSPDGDLSEVRRKAGYSETVRAGRLECTVNGEKRTAVVFDISGDAERCRGQPRRPDSYVRHPVNLYRRHWPATPTVSGIYKNREFNGMATPQVVASKWSEFPRVRKHGRLVAVQEPPIQNDATGEPFRREQSVGQRAFDS